MNLDEQISKRVDKGYRFELVNENVIHSYSKQNSKRAVFTALFFYLFKKSAMKFAMKFLNK